MMDAIKEKGSPRPGGKKIISEKDLSDGRDEKEKIAEMLARQEEERIEEIRKMDEWRKKQND